MLGLVLDSADEHGLGDFSTSGYEIAIAASISLTIEARVFGLPASAFSRATKSNFSPRTCAELNSRPNVTWRNSSEHRSRIGMRLPSQLVVREHRVLGHHEDPVA